MLCRVPCVLRTRARIAGVWSGNLALESVRLLPGPIPGTPLCVVEGSVRRLVLKFPWKHLKTRPVVMQVEALEVIYGPQRGAVSEAERERERRAALERKRELLRVLDEEESGGGGGGGGDDDTPLEAAAGGAGPLSPRGSGSSVGAEEEEEDGINKSFRERLLDTVLSNVEITIKGVRLEYRDAVSVPERPFAFVATVASLEVRACNAQWQPQFIARASEQQLLRKQLKLSDLRVHFAQHPAAGGGGSERRGGAALN
eukprot:COSAG01_NODE_4468_length_4998_cov_52.401715_3_plen_257_part_00